ncbi:MAG: type II secretion system protein [Sarcina sp.]
MLKTINNKQKKKGFTLIELVIVLAVLAIIALIAIPNFTKVRNDSLIKADIRTAEQVKNITLMAIADQNIELPSESNILTYTLNFGNDKNIVNYNNGTTNISNDDYFKMLSEVKKPQVKDKTVYVARINAEGQVAVSYVANATGDAILAGNLN